ncbi:MAG TPA: 3-phenylpropionate dioxygenase, partial [Gammaproteobacteria bacterium]|nr:3-phenylpropionate dioxygenase [Gammaproteobacteria bacterium]
MNSPLSPSALQKWTDHTRVPFSVYTDPDIYRLELERIFYGPFWQPVALVAEIPEVGDYKTFYIGETPVIVTHTGENEF